MTLKLFSLLFGYPYKAVKTQTIQSKQKIVTLGTLMLIPVVLWAFSGFYLSYKMMEAGLIISLLVSLVLAVIILIVDRSFIATPPMKNRFLLGSIRIAFGFISALLGSIALDLMIFEGDLEEYRSMTQDKSRNKYMVNHIENHGQELVRMKQELDKAGNVYTGLHNAYLDELDGSGGTGKYGRGAVAKAKEEEKNRAYQRLMQIENDYVAEMKRLESEATKNAENAVQKRKDAFLSKIRDLHYFAFSEFISGAFYLLFLFFFVLLEIFFVLYKMMVSDSLFEQMMKYEEETGLNRLRTMRDFRSEIDRQDGLLGQRAATIRQLNSRPSPRRIV